MVYVMASFRNLRFGANGLRTEFSVREHIVCGIYTVVMFMYGLVRLCMMVEVLRELPYLPADAFQVASWSGYLPHFS